MRVNKRMVDVRRANARLSYLKEKSSNKEVGVLVVKELAQGALVEVGIDGVEIRKPISVLKNKEVHKKFVGNLMSAVSDKVLVGSTE